MYMRISAAKAFLALAFLVGGVGQATAGTISGLYSTGVDNSGQVLPDTTIDPHYTISPGGNVFVALQSGGFPIPPYIGDNAVSAWVTPNRNNSAAGDYVFRTTFTSDSQLVSILGDWSTDNEGLAIYLNGQDIGVPGTLPTQFSSGFVPFSFTSNFGIVGTNILDFYVRNDPLDALTGNPTALRVEFPLAYGPSIASPEPATMTLLGLGIAGMAGYGWRRRKQSVSR